MKYIEALEAIKNDETKNLSFTAEFNGDTFELWGDKHGFCVFTRSGFDINIWALLEIDWVVKVK